MLVAGVGAAADAAPQSVPATVMAVPTARAGTPAAARHRRKHARARKHRRAVRRVAAPRLLQAGDLGSGWSQVAAGDDVADLQRKLQQALAGVTVTPQSCVDGITAPAGLEGIAYRGFRRGTSDFGPYFGQAVARFANAKAAKAAFNAVNARLAQCPELQVDTEYGLATVTVKSAVAPQGSAHATAYAVTGTLMGFRGTGKVALMRRGRWIDAIGLAGLGDTSVLARDTISRAAARVEAR